MRNSRDRVRHLKRVRSLRCATGTFVAVALAVALLSGGASAAPASLTGSWFDPHAASPAPTWHLQANPGLTTLSATWVGGRGHEGLRGSFSGTLNGAQTAYSGTLHITEGSLSVNGTMTFTIQTPDKLSVSYRQSNGVGGTFTLVRKAHRAIRFSFRGYANNVKVVRPLVGDFQLGIARIHGTGTLSSSSIDGTIDGSNHPLFTRYAPNSMRAQVVGYSYHQAAHGTSTTLQLTIQITQTDAPRCAAGDRGTLTLYESGKKLSNGQRSDHIVMGNWGGRCPEFVQGWTNEDGGARTSPHFGGPPHGGQWAIVKISS
jgi:hypothetical protein